MKWFNWLGVILLMLFVIWLFIPEDPIDINEDELDSQPPILEEETIPKEEGFPIDPRAYYWKDTPIHYYFSENLSCDIKIRNNVLKSFDIIEEKTDRLVKFYEEESENAIEISCLKSDEEDIAGYGGIEYYEGEKEILRGVVELTKPNPNIYEECQTYPSTELHEILHAFGFDHIEDRRSILNSLPEYGESCTQIDSEIVNCLKYIYSKGQENYTCKEIPFIDYIIL